MQFHRPVLEFSGHKLKPTSVSINYPPSLTVSRARESGQYRSLSLIHLPAVPRANKINTKNPLKPRPKTATRKLCLQPRSSATGARQIDFASCINQVIAMETIMWNSLSIIIPSLPGVPPDPTLAQTTRDQYGRCT